MTTMDTNRISTFINGYDHYFNEFANKAAANYFERIKEDLAMVKLESTGIIQKKFGQIDTMINDPEQKVGTYEKVKVIGLILADIAPDLTTANQEVKRSSTNIINGFFDVARKTKDNSLLETMQSISERIAKAKQLQAA